MNGRGDAPSPTGTPIRLGNEFAAVEVGLVDGRNGARVLIRSPESGRWVLLCPLELEALTWQNERTFSEMVGRSGESLFDDEPSDHVDDRS